MQVFSYPLARGGHFCVFPEFPLHVCTLEDSISNCCNKSLHFFTRLLCRPTPITIGLVYIISCRFTTNVLFLRTGDVLTPESHEKASPTSDHSAGAVSRNKQIPERLLRYGLGRCGRPGLGQQVREEPQVIEHQGRPVGRNVADGFFELFARMDPWLKIIETSWAVGICQEVEDRRVGIYHNLFP